MIQSTEMSNEWFKDWFNSPYYHALYKNRDNKEADLFITKLANYLELPKNSKIWDLACGKGRHSVKLSTLGYHVIGTDLSENSIKEASKNASDNLDFYIHDMRTPFRINYFNAVFNLFTSIGYFENELDSKNVFKNVANSLTTNGFLVIDFLNATKVIKELVFKEIVEREGMDYTISKEIKNNRIVKGIAFNVDGKNYYFEEKVFLYKSTDFINFADTCNLKLIHQFGNYNLESFDEANSDRLIMIFKK